MQSCLYNTDPRWIRSLRASGVRDHVNFWRKDRRILNPPPGSSFYFKELGMPHVVGRGYFRESLNLAPDEAWERFGPGNGYATKPEFMATVEELLGSGADQEDTLVNCIVLDGLEWLSAPITLPAGFFPQGVQGAKFYEDDQIEFLASAFVADTLPGEALSPLVLFEAEATVEGRYDDWSDVTGERYHFPNQYKNRIVPGRRFIYYRGVRRKDGGRGLAEYFGHGRIGAVWLDATTALAARKTDQAWFCSIEDYTEFPTAIASNQAGNYFEEIDHARGWQVGVRLISDGIYRRILEAAGFRSEGGPADVSTAQVGLALASNLLRPRTARTVQTGGATKSYRRSRRAAAIGRRAEELVFNFLRASYADVRWLSNDGELPGYDIAYRHSDVEHAVEVKGTSGSYFPAIELTANELKAAEQLGDRFSLYLVSSCESGKPQLEVINNPFELLRAGRATVSPLILRFELRQSPENRPDMDLPVGSTD